jgi:hypothetical protein
MVCAKKTGPKVKVEFYAQNTAIKAGIRAGGMAQAVEPLPHKYKALNSTSPQKTQKNREQENKDSVEYIKSRLTC